MLSQRGAVGTVDSNYFRPSEVVACARICKHRWLKDVTSEVRIVIVMEDKRVHRTRLDSILTGRIRTT